MTRTRWIGRKVSLAPDSPTSQLNRSGQLRCGMGLREAAGDRGTEVLEAIMAALITIAIVVAVAGVVCGAYLKICFAIRRDDRRRGALRRDAPNQSAQSARAVVGMNSFGWK
jgi:hypothetical protein